MRPFFTYWGRARQVAWSDTQALLGEWRGRAVEAVLAVIAYLLLIQWFPDQASGAWGSLLTAVGALAIVFAATFVGFFVMAPVKLEALSISDAVDLALARHRSLAAQVIDRRLEEGSELRDRLAAERTIGTSFVYSWLDDVRAWQGRCLRTVRKCHPDQAATFKARVGPVQGGMGVGWMPYRGWPQKLDATLADWMAELERLR